jgi:hypothetical protein
MRTIGRFRSPAKPWRNPSRIALRLSGLPELCRVDDAFFIHHRDLVDG